MRKLASEVDEVSAKTDYLALADRWEQLAERAQTPAPGLTGWAAGEDNPLLGGGTLQYC